MTKGEEWTKRHSAHYSQCAGNITVPELELSQLVEERDRLKAQLDSVQKANAELREFALSHFSRNQVKPLIEALRRIQATQFRAPISPGNAWKLWDAMTDQAQQALAHARSIGMEKP